jgi:hypothetical protein
MATIPKSRAISIMSCIGIVSLCSPVQRPPISATKAGASLSASTGLPFSLSNDVGNPPRPHPLHVGSVLRIVAQEIFFDQALDRDEPHHAHP